MVSTTDSSPVSSTGSTSEHAPTTGMVHVCGNGVVEPPEECDGGSLCLECVRDRVVFLTSLKFDPATLGGPNGTDGADTLCNDFAQSAGLDGVFKAWLSTPTTSPSTSFVPSAGRYVRTDGVAVADSWDDLTDGDLAAPIRWSEKGKELGAVAAWTSTLPNGEWSGDPACGAWSSNLEMGSAGGGPFTDSRWTQLEPLPVDCDFPLALYCFEQGS